MNLKQTMAKKLLPTLALAIVTLFAAKSVLAEPYLAQRYGQKCMACHTNITGGGKRNAIGNSYTLALSDSSISTSFSPALSEKISVGGNLRADYTYTAFDSPDSNAEGITVLSCIKFLPSN